jgi:transposase
MGAMGKGRPKAELVLSDEERAQLVRGARAAHSTQAYALRCRIVLACADGATNTEVAVRFGVSLPTVGKWRSRFVANRMSGLADAPRAGRPALIGQDQVEHLVAVTLRRPPEQAKFWSRSSMAAYSGLSASTVGRIWRRFDLRPHRQDGFMLSVDPQFQGRVVDVVGLYRNPPERAVVLCTDENSRTHGLAESRLVMPAAPAPPHRSPREHDPTRPSAGPHLRGDVVVSEPRSGRRASGYRKFLVAIDKAVPAELDLHVVGDNEALHRSGTVRTWLTCHPRFHLHFTPAGSWLEQAEHWFRLLDDQFPRHDPNTAAPDPESHNWIRITVGDCDPLAWVRTAEGVYRSLRRHRQRSSGASSA